MSSLTHNNFLVNGIKLSSSNNNAQPSFDFRSGANVGVVWTQVAGSCQNEQALYRNIETGVTQSFSIPETDNCKVFDFKIACTTSNCFIAWRENYSSNNAKLRIASADNTGYIKDTDLVEDEILDYDIAPWKNKAVLAFTKGYWYGSSVKAELFELENDGKIRKERDIHVQSSSCFEKEAKVSSNANIFSVSYNEVCSSKSEIEASVYNSNGDFIKEIVVSADNSANKVNGDSHILSNGNLVYTWTESNKVYYSLFNSNGNTIKGPTLVSHNSGLNNKDSKITSYADKFIISFVSSQPSNAVYIQRFENDGERFATIGSAVKINDINSFSYDIKSYNKNSIDYLAFTWSDKYGSSVDVFQGYKEVNYFFDFTKTNTTSESLSHTESHTHSLTDTESKTASASSSHTSSASNSETSSATSSTSASESISITSSLSDSGSKDNPPTHSLSESVSGSDSLTSTLSESISSTDTRSDSGSKDNPPTHSDTGSSSESQSASKSHTLSESLSQSESRSLSATESASQSQSSTKSSSATSTESNTASSTSTLSETSSQSESKSSSQSISASQSRSFSETISHELTESQSISLECPGKNIKIKLAFERIEILEKPSSGLTGLYNISTHVVSSNNLNQGWTYHPQLTIDHESKDYFNSFYDYIKPNLHIKSGIVSYITDCVNNVQRYVSGIGSNKDPIDHPQEYSYDWYAKNPIPSYCLSSSSHHKISHNSPLYLTPGQCVKSKMTATFGRELLDYSAKVSLSAINEFGKQMKGDELLHAAGCVFKDGIPRELVNDNTRVFATVNGTIDHEALQGSSVDNDESCTTTLPPVSAKLKVTNIQKIDPTDFSVYKKVITSTKTAKNSKKYGHSDVKLLMNLEVPLTQTSPFLNQIVKSNKYILDGSVIFERNSNITAYSINNEFGGYKVDLNNHDITHPWCTTKTKADISVLRHGMFKIEDEVPLKLVPGQCTKVVLSVDLYEDIVRIFSGTANFEAKTKDGYPVCGQQLLDLTNETFTVNTGSINLVDDCIAEFGFESEIKTTEAQYPYIETLDCNV